MVVVHIPSASRDTQSESWRTGGHKTNHSSISDQKQYIDGHICGTYPD